MLWSGFEKGMLELAARFAEKTDQCTIERSMISANFVNRCGSWDKQTECIIDTIKGETGDTIAVDEAVNLRKRLWDEISLQWAQQRVRLCVAFIPERPDFKKTLFQIEFPSIQDNVRIIIVRVRGEIPMLGENANDDVNFQLYYARNKTFLPKLTDGIFDQETRLSPEYAAWTKSLRTNAGWYDTVLQAMGVGF